MTHTVPCGSDYKRARWLISRAMRKPAQTPPTAVRRFDGWVLVDAASDRILISVRKRLKLGSVPTETSSGFLVDGGLTRATPRARRHWSTRQGVWHGEQLKLSAGVQSRSLGWRGCARLWHLVHVFSPCCKNNARGHRTRRTIDMQ